MPDQIGSAVYSLDVDLDKFDAKLKLAETKLKGTTSRFASESAAETAVRQRTVAATRQATSEIVSGSGRVVTAQQAQRLAAIQANEAQLLQTATAATTATALAGAAKKTTKLTDAQKIMNNTLRTNASVMAQSIPQLRGFSSGLGAAAIAAPQAAVAIIGLSLAYGLLDAGVKKFTGAGLIDHLTGAARAHDIAARAAKSQGDILDTIARIRVEGVGAATARDLGIVDTLDKITLAQERFTKAVERRRRALKDAFPSGISPGGEPVAELAAKGPPLQRLNADLKESAKQLVEAKLSLSEYYRILQQFPELRGVKEFAEALAKQERAADLASVALARYEAIVSKVLDKQSLFSGALGDLNAITDMLDPQIEALRLEQLQLRQLETKMGDAFGEANQARLQEVTRLIEAATARQEIATQSVSVFGAEIRAQYGELAPAAIENVAAALSKLPTDQQIAIKVLLPDLFAIKGAFAAFIAELNRSANVVIAIRAASIAGFGSSIDVNQPFIGGTVGQIPGLNPLDFPSDAALDWEKQLTDTINRINENSAGPLGAIADKAAKAGTELTYLQKVMQAVSDGVITLSEALELGLSDQQVVTLELEKARGDELAASFRLRIGLLALARAYPGLTGEQIRYVVGLAAIQAHLASTGETIAQFLRKVNTGILDTARSAIDTLLGGPTRESLEQELRLKQLQRQKIVLEGQGADASRVDNVGKPGSAQPSAADRALKKINDQIEAQSRIADLRQNEIDQLRIKAQLADETIRTDRDLINAYTWLFGVVSNFSSALQDATTFLHDFSGMGAAPEASFAGGISNVPRPMRAMLHTGERVLTASENRQLSAGTPAVTFSQQFTVNADMSDAAMNRLADIVERANTRSLNRWRGSVLGGRGTN